MIDIDSTHAEKILEAESEQETVSLQMRSETEEALKTFLKVPNKAGVCSNQFDHVSFCFVNSLTGANL